MGGNESETPRARDGSGGVPFLGLRSGDEEVRSPGNCSLLGKHLNILKTTLSTVKSFGHNPGIILA